MSDFFQYQNTNYHSDPTRNQTSLKSCISTFSSVLEWISRKKTVSQNQHQKSKKKVKTKVFFSDQVFWRKKVCILRSFIEKKGKKVYIFFFWVSCVAMAVSVASHQGQVQQRLGLSNAKDAHNKHIVLVKLTDTSLEALTNYIKHANKVGLG